MVLITGASSGIGRDMAIYLGSKGYDLILVARDKKKLEEVKNKINTKVEIIAMDLGDINNCYKLYEMLKDKDIDILVNNAGFGDAGNFNQTSLQKELSMIDLNIISYHILTKLFLKDFIKKNRGRILNIASMAGFMPGPYMATYYATKSYVLNLSLAISEELKQENSNVKISVFCQGPVTTNFNNVANVKFNIKPISATYAARYAIDNMFANKLVIVPPNMKLNRILTKISPIKLTLLVESKVQQRVSK